MYNSWDLSETQKADPEEIWTCFQTQIEPKANFRVARLCLQKYKQKEEENIDDFVSRSKLQAFKCEFRSEKDCPELNGRILEQMIAATKHQDLQK